jgi:serine/threonine protein kinase
LKAISKEWTIMQREIEHTKSERDILATVAEISHPFLIKLHHSFQDADQLFLVLEFYVGGDMATQLAKHYRFDAERCRLYIAEILLGLQELHRIGVLYRDLKPENILIAADGHIVLTDFGLSKQFAPSFIGDSQKTNTFCGTAEYLAPEILRAEPYSFEVDFWSLGTLLYEFLTGITPFWAETHTDMYRRVLEDELAFPEGFDPITADFIDGLLQRDPSRRLGAGPNGPQEICSHPYFDSLDWEDVFHKRITPSYVPDLKSDMDFSNFDDTFLQMVPRISSPPGKIILTSEIQDIFDGYSYTESVLDSDDIIYSTDVSDELYVDHHDDSQQFSPEPEDAYAFDTDSAISGKHTSRVIGSDMADVMPTIDSSDDELDVFNPSAHYLAKKRLNESTSYQESPLPRSHTMVQSDGSNSSFGGYSDQERKRFSKRRNTIDIEPTAEGNIVHHGFSLATLPSTQATSMFSSVHKIDKTENLVCAVDRLAQGNDHALSDDESMEPSPQSTSVQVPDEASMTIPDFDSEKTLDLELPIYKLIDINTKSSETRRHSTPSSFNFRFPDISATFPVFKRKSKRYQRAI